MSLLKIAENTKRKPNKLLIILNQIIIFVLNTFLSVTRIFI